MGQLLWGGGILLASRAVKNESAGDRESQTALGNSLSPVRLAASGDSSHWGPVSQDIPRQNCPPTFVFVVAQDIGVEVRPCF